MLISSLSHWGLTGSLSIFDFMKKIAVTLTTINMPIVLEKLLAQQVQYSHPEFQVDYLIAGDRKTPSEVASYVSSLQKKSTSRIVYLGIKEQQEKFGHLTDLWNHIPENSFARRNYVDLMAYQEGYDVIIRIDDDNFPTNDDFFGAHGIVGDSRKINVTRSSDGWVNVCTVLNEKENIPFYPRGYPYEKRWFKHEIMTQEKQVKVALNAGLWIGDPDVDAVTRLCKPIDVTGLDSKKYGSTFALDKGTWCPINTQNTAFSRETIPAAFISPFAGRYDDIYSGYFLRCIMDHLDDSITYGVPLLNQIRNQHNLWKDLQLEWIGNQTADKITQLLRKIEFSNKDYLACFKELITSLRKNINFETEYFTKLLDGMSIWSEVFAKL